MQILLTINPVLLGDCLAVSRDTLHRRRGESGLFDTGWCSARTFLCTERRSEKAINGALSAEACRSEEARGVAPGIRDGLVHLRNTGIEHLVAGGLADAASGNGYWTPSDCDGGSRRCRWRSSDRVRGDSCDLDGGCDRATASGRADRRGELIIISKVLERDALAVAERGPLSEAVEVRNDKARVGEGPVRGREGAIDTIDVVLLSDGFPVGAD